jgi:hypothetical protein
MRPLVRTHAVDNGLLSRTDSHRFFDDGYVTLTSDYGTRSSGALALKHLHCRHNPP